MVNNSAPERLSFAAADSRLAQALSASFESDYDNVLLFDGDLVLEGASSTPSPGSGVWTAWTWWWSPAI
ncbi:hypothetical protein ACFQ2K_43450 [Streptomyces sanglieri]|uniref:Uncharacterized protein n=1 Tax=Streptomyces sanglieri TaxID=193460 RepID=A0ABW2X9E1_9ACTN